MKNYIILIVCLYCSGLMRAQTCGTLSPEDEIRARQDLTVQEKDQVVAAYHQNIEKPIRAFQARHRGNQKLDEVIIPVVVHIFHNNGPENISDAQVYDMLRIMNEDFNAENAALSNLHPNYQDRIGNGQIRFNLATLDPARNCTPGIVRYLDPNTYYSSQTETNQLKVAYSWPTNKYLNVFVVGSIAPGLGGYAQFPGTNPATDGIVVRHAQAGSIGTGSSTGGSTMTHEAGHWFGLYHTWGKTNNPGLAQNCNDDDEVADTPLTIGNSSCNLNAQSCGSHDNVQNFMEYSFCYSNFTTGQVNRMRGAIATDISRRNLYSEANIEATGTNYPIGERPTHLCEVDFTKSLGLEQEACAGVSMQFFDASLFDITSWSWSFPGGNPTTSAEQNPMVVYEEPGYYPVTLNVVNGNGETGSLTKEEFVIIEDHPELDVPFTEEFADGSIFDIYPFGAYQVINPENDSYWITVGEGYNDNNALGLYVNNVEEDSYDAIQTTGIELDQDNYALSFYYSHAYKINQRHLDEMQVEISQDCGKTWTTLDLLTSEVLGTVSDRDAFFEPTSSADWKYYSRDLTAYTGNNVLVRLGYNHREGNNVFIDKFSVSNTVGIPDRLAVNELNIYPNPVTSGSTVYIKNLTAEATVGLFNAQGKYIEVPFAAGETKGVLDTRTLPSGVYHLLIEHGGTTIAKKLVIVKP